MCSHDELGAVWRYSRVLEPCVLYSRQTEPSKLQANMSNKGVPEHVANMAPRDRGYWIGVR